MAKSVALSGLGKKKSSKKVLKTGSKKTLKPRLAFQQKTKLTAKPKGSLPSKAQKAMGFNFGQKVTRKPDVLSRFRSDGVVVIVKIDCDSHFFQLDEVAAEFWAEIDGRKSVDQISKILEQRHKTAKNLIRKEIPKLLQDLVKNELVEI